MIIIYRSYKKPYKSHFAKCFAVDVQDGVGAQSYLVAEFQYTAVVDTTHFVPAVGVIFIHLPGVETVD